MENTVITQYVPKDFERLRVYIETFGLFAGIVKFITAPTMVELTAWNGQYLQSSTAAKELTMFSHLRAQERQWQVTRNRINATQAALLLSATLLTIITIVSGAVLPALAAGLCVTAGSVAQVHRVRSKSQYKKNLAPASELRAELHKADDVIRGLIAERTTVVDASLRYPWWYFSDAATPAVQEFMEDWEALTHKNVDLMDNMEIFLMAEKWAELQDRIFEIDKKEESNPLWSESLKGQLRRYGKMLEREDANEFEKELSQDRTAALRNLVTAGINEHYKSLVKA